jgi:type II secretory pathway component GspD/PulD (secretin)
MAWFSGHVEQLGREWNVYTRPYTSMLPGGSFGPVAGIAPDQGLIGYDALLGVGATTAAQFLNYMVYKGHAKVVTRSRITVQNQQTGAISTLKRIPYQQYPVQSNTTNRTLGSLDANSLQEQSDPTQPGRGPNVSATDPGLVPGEKAEGLYVQIRPTIGVQTLSADVVTTVNSLVGYTKLDAPIIAERRVSTTVTLTPDKLFVLGGVDKETFIRGASRIPILGQVPILGYWCGVETEGYRRSYLVITIKPRIRNKLLYNSMLLEFGYGRGDVPKEIRDLEKRFVRPNPNMEEDAETRVGLEEMDAPAPDLKWGYGQWGLE